jgi:hypothetical protein
VNSVRHRTDRSRGRLGKSGVSLAAGSAAREWVEALEQRQLLSVSAGSSILVFSGVSGSGPTANQTVTVTNTGSSAITLGQSGVSIVDDSAVSGDDSSHFSVSNLGSTPASLAAGAAATFNVNFTPTSAGLHSAFLKVTTNDAANPTVSIALRGLGTTGTGGGNEPSLAAILRAYEIPTIVGDGPNDSNAFASTFYPATPDASSQEVVMPRLTKAGSGPVSISLLGAFAVSNQPALRFGYYTPGDANSETELFGINQADAQTVHPTAQGATAFDPGSATFGLYANFPTFTDNGHQRLSYSEDALNTWDTNVPRKIRFFPLENADGSAVPNAYVFAAEDNNLPFGPIQPYDSNDIVGIIRNVMPATDATTAPVLGLSSAQSVAGTSRLIFNRIQNLNSNNPAGFVDIVHDTNTLTITNTGDRALSITGLSFFDVVNGTASASSGVWQIVSPPSLPASVAAGGTLNLTIKFVATTNPNHTDNQTNDTATTNGISSVAAGGVWNGQLRIASNDPVNPTRLVDLAGYWQNTSENENEPGLQPIVNGMLGFGTTINSTVLPQYPNNGTTPVYYGEEVNSAYWNVADSTLPVSVMQLASYHSQYDFTVMPPNPTSAGIYWFAQGSSGTLNALFRTVNGEGQSVLPYASGGSTSAPASATFSPTGTFGWNLDGESSLDSLNTTDRTMFSRSGHSVRFFPVRDGSGKLVPNTFLVVMDYENTEFDNSDFQDNVYIVSNMRPATQAPAPTDVQAVNVAGGAVSIQWAPVNDGTLSGYNVYRATSAAGPYTKLDTSPFSQTTFTDSNPGAGTVFYRVTAVDTAGESLGANALVAISTVIPTDILTSADINSTPAGSTSIVTSATNYDVVAGGADIGGTTADGFRFLYEQVQGDFDAKVQVNSLTEVIPNTFAGLMARETLTAGSAMAFSGASASNGYRFNYRATTDAAGTFNQAGTVAYPNVWVRLVRQGNVFTGYYGTDGTNWTQSGQITIALPTTIYVGLAVASHSTTQTTTAQLRGFSLIGVTVLPTLTPAEQVAADRVTLKTAQTDRVSELKAAQLTLQNDQKAYAAAKKALAQAKAAARKAHQPIDSIDPAFLGAVNAALAKVQQDRTSLATLRKTTAAAIKAAQKTLAADLVIYRKSLHKKP